MKTFLIIPAITVLLTFTVATCKKDKDQKYVSGRIIHKYKKTGIEGVTVQIGETTPGIFSFNYEFWDKGVTDSNGEFKLKVQEPVENSGHRLETFQPEVFDTTKPAWKFKPIITGVSDLTNTITVELLPCGIIGFRNTPAERNAVNIDTLVITSPYETQIFPSNDDRLVFYVDPSMVHEFIWYTVKNGINGTVHIEHIYIPNYYKSNGDASMLQYHLNL